MDYFFWGMFELRMEIRLQLGSAFVHHFDIFLLCHNYVDMFELRMEITLQLCFVFARHCDVFFITSELRYLFARCSYELRYISSALLRNSNKKVILLVFSKNCKF